MTLPTALSSSLADDLDGVRACATGADSNPQLFPGLRMESGNSRRILANKRPAIGKPDIRNLVLRRWKKVLGQNPDVEAQTWSEAGGDSLKLFEFVLPLERELDCALPFDLFHGEMRLDDVVARIRDAMGPRVAERPDTQKPVVFLMPGIGGDEPLLARFRNDLKDQVRFIVLNYPGLPDLLRPGFNFDRIVKSVCDQITAESPDRNVRIVGYSFGGLVAYAVALRLLTTGLRVKFLGILDTSLQLARQEALYKPRGPVQSAGYLASDISQRGLFSGLIFKLVLQPRLRPVVARLAPLGRVPAESRALLWYRHKAVLFLRWDLALRWLRRLEPVRVSTFSALFRSEQYAKDETADMGWGALLDPLTVVQVRGDHHSMFWQTGDATLAKLFFDKLMSAETEPTGRDTWAENGLEVDQKASC